MEGSCRRDWLPQADEPECSNRDCSLPQYRSCRRDCEDHSRPSHRFGFQAPGQYALLRMQSVFGLVENHRMRTIHNLIGNFLAAMRRQAMHKNGVGLCARHQPAVDLITLKQIVAASADAAGVATRKWKSKRCAACIHDVSTFVASPVQATVRPRIGPRRSSKVMTSAST